MKTIDQIEIEVMRFRRRFYESTLAVEDVKHTGNTLQIVFKKAPDYTPYVIQFKNVLDVKWTLPHNAFKELYLERCSLMLTSVSLINSFIIHSQTKLLFCGFVDWTLEVTFIEDKPLIMTIRKAKEVNRRTRKPITKVIRNAEASSNA